MTDRDALLAAVLARPADDLPRLVFADWLEETGHTADAARAAFIRAQVEAEALPPESPERAALERAAAELFREYGAGWTRQLPEWVTWRPTKVTYRRGFVEELTTTPRRLLRDGHELFAVAPVHTVRLRPQVHFSDSTPELFKDRPYFARITTLRLGPRLLNAAPLRGKSRDPLDIYWLTIARNLNALRALDVSENDLTDDWVARFAHRFRLMAFAGALRVLDLSDNQLTDRAAEVLAETPGFEAVRLRLRGNRITPAGAARLRGRYGEAVEV